MSLRLTAACLFASLCGCATTSRAPEGPQVAGIRIRGTKKLSEREIKSRILTAENGLLSFLPWEDTQHFDPTAWEADKRRIERLYQANGFYQARVVGDEVTPVGKDSVLLTVQVQEGEATRIGSLEVTGLEALPVEHREKALEKLGLETGDIFLEEKWTGVKDLLRQRLRERGYAEATAEGEVEVDVQTRLAAVRLVVTPGQRFRFGQIVASPEPKAVVSEKRIVEQARGAIRPGDWYSESALAEAQARVFQMGVFGGVKVTRGAPDREAGTVPVIIDVREAKFHSVRGGPGLGVDNTSWSARLIGEYTHRNFLGGLRRLTLSGRAGWTFIPTLPGVIVGVPGAMNGPIFGLRAELEQPRILIPTLRLQGTLDTERGLEPAYAYSAARGRLALTWQPHTAFGLTGAYDAEVYWLQSGSAGYRDVSTLGFGCAGLCVLSFVELVAEWDRRDDRNDPRNGTYVSAAVQYGGWPGSFQYVRLLPEVRGYISFLKEDRLTFSAKLKVGTLIPLVPGQESPIVARFFSGGAFMRGFNGRRLSPMMEVPRDFSDAPDDYQKALRREIPAGNIIPIGGNGLFEASFEARYAFQSDVMLATFLDMGFVSQEPLPGGEIFNRMYYAVGTGIRYLTLVGIIRLDFGYRLPFGPPQVLDVAADPSPVIDKNGVVRPVLVVRPPTYEERSGSCFGIGAVVRSVGSPRTRGGSPEDPCVLQLSIGQAF